MLEYQLQQGQVEQTIIEQAVKAGVPIPDRILNAPNLLPGLELYYQGFKDLISSRSVGLSIGPISWVTVQQYCQMNDFDSDQTEAMHHHVILMDSVYLKHHEKKTK